MDKKFSKILLWTFIFIFIFSFPVLAVENEKLLSSDITQKKYERKVVIGLDIGLSKRKLVFRVDCPITICGVGSRRWVYTIDQNLENEISHKVYDWIITQRFDKIVITPDKAYIITAQKKITVDKGSMASFSFEVGSYSDFKNAVERYLNNELSPIVEDLMSSALEQRYKELPEKEQETFITTKAKELGIPVEIARKLMNSAFVFAVYVDFNEEKANIVCSFEKENVLLGKGPYHTTMEIPTKIKVVVYKFDADKGKFVFYKEFNGSSGIGAEESEDFALPPNNASTQKLFEKSIITSVKASGVSVNTALKEDENFAIFATVDEVSGNWFYETVKSDIGVLEDLRVDAPFWVKENINGKMENVGFVKARKVFINCKKRGLSEFQLIRGKAELKDQLKEHPWTGFFVYFQGGQETYKITKFDIYDISSGGGTFTVIKGGAALDLGYALNKETFSEVWLEVNLGLGFGGKKWERQAQNATSSTDSPFYLTGGVGIYKRFYFTNLGIYIAPGAEIALDWMKASDKVSSDNYSVYSYALKPEIKFGYTYSPNFEVSGYIGWNIPVITKGKWENTNVDAEAEGGIVFGIALDYHIRTVGFFGKLYKKPSSVCREKVEMEEKEKKN